MGRARFLICSLCLFIFQGMHAEDGYRLWLRYAPITNAQLKTEYNATISSLYTLHRSPTIDIAVKELTTALSQMLGKPVAVSETVADGSVILVKSTEAIARELQLSPPGKDGDGGFLIVRKSVKGKNCTIISAHDDVGLLYGVFHLLRLMQTEKPIANLNISTAPSVKNRILNHWDNLDRTVERGYAGFSIWDWHRLPELIDQRYIDYARATASIGINGTVLTNVNANALILTEPYLKKVKALADVFRPYGIRVYLTARFSAPMETGGLSTADPLSPEVQNWWKMKTNEIYQLIPDFGGFLVKANSEGQPGPQNYGRDHADGANVLARALKPHNGIVMWRAFVYSNENPEDRVKQAYNEFMPLDGQFDSNVLVQVKNGPLDFQPREPFSPLFGAMKKTPLMMEFQLTQEYLGQATHLVYLGTLFSEVLQSDTYQKGKGSTVRKAIDGTLHGHELSAIAGVANIGNDRNWCGHQFAQSNWYAYGRMAWNLDASPEDVCREWVAQTFSPDTEILQPITSMMMGSREILVNYMTPLGLHHIMGYNHHYGPGPWVANKQREDWTSVYYHKADSNGIGFNRTPSGSNALSQYHPTVSGRYLDPASCPEEYLLWFHHVPWSFKMKSGKDLWEELCVRYADGTKEVNTLRTTWAGLKDKIDPERFHQVKSLLDIQYIEASWWRDACLVYFEKVSGRKIPTSIPRPGRDLDYFMSLEFPYAPGIRPKW